MVTEETGYGIQVKHASEVQAEARKMLRRLMADRNMRTTQISTLLGEESHTVRRILNGSRAITLDDIVRIATLGGFSLDESFLQLDHTPIRPQQAESVDSSLSRVFSAIADLLSSGGATSATQVSHPASATSYQEEPSPLPRQSEPGMQQKRGRGRPRKVELGPDGLPGPRW